MKRLCPARTVSAVVLAAILVTPFAVAQTVMADDLGGVPSEDAVTAAELKNRPELSRPLLDRKLILAHYMTNWLGYPKAAPYAKLLNPVPEGTPAEVAGTKSVAPMWAMVREPALLPLDAAAREEIRQARRMGLDGFQFFYPINMSDGFLKAYNNVVAAFVRQAEKHAPDFRITLCLCGPRTPASEAEMRAQWGDHIRELLDQTGDSPVWLRTPDGRLVFYLWVPEGLVQAQRGPEGLGMHSAEGIAATAVAYEKLARVIDRPIAYVFHMRGRSDDAYANRIFDYFPAAWRWTEGDTSGDVPRLMALAQRRDRLFSPSVYPGFFGHNYIAGDERSHRQRGELGDYRPDQLWRPYMKTAQTRLYRNLLSAAVDSDAQLISYITWNDWTEATHLIPSVNYDFTLGVLLNYYRNIWLGHPERNDHEIALVAYKKHRLDRPASGDIPYRVMNRDDFGTLEEESRREVITILKQPAEVLLNGQPLGTAEAGLTVFHRPFAPGPVRVQVQRDGRDVLTLNPSEWATNTPRRNDTISVIRSTAFDRYFNDLFGEDAEPYRLNEYAPR